MSNTHVIYLHTIKNTVLSGAHFSHLRINPQILPVFISDGIIRDFAAFLILKNHYKNSCIFNPTDSKLAQVLNVSRQTAMRYRRVFEAQKWICYRDGNMLLKKVKSITSVCGKENEMKIASAANVYLKIGGVPLKELVIKLKYLIIKQKEINRDYLLKLRQDLCNVEGVRELKKIKYKLKKYNVKEDEQIGEIDYRLQISYKKLSNLLGCSIGSAYNIVKSMCKKEFLKAYKRREILLSGIHDYIWETVLRYKKEYAKCFYANGFVIRNHSNKYYLIA